MAGAISSVRRISDVEISRPSLARSHLHLTDVQNYRGIINVGHDCQMAETGDNFAQEFETLASKIGRLIRQTGDIAARLRQTGNQPVSNRISRYREDDGDDRCGLLRCEDRWSALRYNRIDLEPDEFGHEFGETLVAPFGPAIFNRDIATFNPTKLAQSLHESGGPFPLSRGVLSPEKPDGR